MRNVDVVIVGGGLAGSAAAVLLGRAGIPALVVDPHTVYPPDFRCEKFGGGQLDVIRRAGLSDVILPATTPDGETWIARYGRVLDRRPGDQRGIRYEDLVNTIRAAIPPQTPFVDGKAAGIATSDDRQLVTLADGETISARLVVLATGLNIGLRHQLGIERTVISACHSITIGFDIAAVGRAAFPFRALTYYPESPSYRMAYLTLFPIGAAMRANLMVYRDMDDPWLRAMRQTPEDALREIMPGLERTIGAFTVNGPVKIRPADLYVTSGHRQAGIVLVGDAFCTSCPAAGTGTDKVFTDIARLCQVHIPQWLATPGMNADKIAAFYNDPAKTGNDRRCEEAAFNLRDLSVNPGLPWRVRRGIRFAARLATGLFRRWRGGPTVQLSSRGAHHYS